MELTTELKELAGNLQFRCKQFEHCMSIGTSIRDYLAPIEEKWKIFLNKEKTILENFDAPSKAAYAKLDLHDSTEHMIIQTREKILDIQSKAIVELNTIFTNFGKDSPDRKTAVYAEKKMRKLTKAWETVVDINDAIKLFPDQQDSYFSTGVFQKEKEKFSTLKGKLENIIKNKGEGEKTKDKIADLQEQINRDHQDDDDQGHKNDEEEEDTFGNPEQKKRIKKQKIKIEKFWGTLNKVDHIIAQNSKNYLLRFQSEVTQTWREIMNADDDIQTNQGDDETLVEYGNQYQQIEEEYDETSDKIQAAIDQHETVSQQKHSTKIKIKPLELGNFSGDYKMWNTFFETFLDVVQRAGCSDVEKFHYLINSLDGDAKRIISHLEVSGANYNAAIELLKERFENRRKVTTLYLDTIIELPILQHRSAEGIIKMHDTLSDCITNLNKLGCETKTWGPIITQLMMRKLDYDSLKTFEEQLEHPKELISLDYFIEFLRSRHHTLDAIKHNKRGAKEADIKPRSKTTLFSAKKQCAFCDKTHALFECETFKNEKLSARRDFINKKKLCTICLSHDNKKRCLSRHTCGVCRKQHNTLLHDETRSKTKGAKQDKQDDVPESTKTTHVSKIDINKMNILLSTAVIKVKSATGEEHLLRALIDPASQATIISENTAQLLNFPREKSNIGIIGMGECQSGTAKTQIKFKIRPRFPSEYTLSVVALILPKITSTMPSEEAVIKKSKFKNVLLADPTFNTPGPIHMVIGADYYGCLIEEGLVKNDGIVAQKTNIGWILTGPALYNNNNDTGKEKKEFRNSFVTNIELNKILETYFEQDEVNQPRTLTSEEKECETHYQLNQQRNKDGTYTVRIPFKQNRKPLGDSKNQAIARFHQIERKFEREPEYKRMYHQFINEYLELGHMKKSNVNGTTQESYYIPHHAVLKESSTTTKLRVVFDASSKSKNGENLNQQCHTGPRLQENLTRLLIRWRMHKYVFTADVEKMYRQIKIHEDDQRYQRIIWRFNKDEPIEEYQLTTVTYGTSAAPYLAIKTLQQLAKDETNTFPRAAKIMLNDFYVDDVLSGGHSFNHAKKKVIELQNAMKKGGFNLRKWVSNDPKLLADIPDENKITSIIEWTDDNIISTLGLQWNPSKDNFQFSIKQPIPQKTLTKRTVLSELAKLYDPLGWVSPILITAKIIMQDMWAENIDWDEEIPKDLRQRSENFFKDIKAIENIKIPRWIQGTPIELHGFCDASTKAFAAVVYTRVQTSDGNFITTMISSKTRTAPLRNKQTLARLELCGAVLLSKLINEIRLSMRCTTVKAFLWTDSEITLAWIKGDPHRWDTYVANRVAEIQQLTKLDTWKHVPSEKNPADCASRGISTQELGQLKLWWHGPEFLATSDWEKEETRKFETNLHERRIKNVCVTSINNDEKIYDRWSNINKTIRIMSYCYRFINRTRKKNVQFDSKETTPEERNNTLVLIIKQFQKNEFIEELQDLNRGKSVKNKNNLLALNPILDEQDIMRVGGRLENSSLTYDQKHPIILKKGHLLTLMIKEAHQKTLHGGIELTTAVIRQKYWIVNLKSQVKKEINNCMTCKKQKARTSHQLMGHLPESRSRPSRPFTHTGVDYAGPITLRLGVRGQKMMKGYIAIFVCFATKAIHIELVSDLTSKAFLAAFKRFIGRRGSPSHMYSDNGTNFVGANKILQDEVKMIQTSLTDGGNALAAQGITWRFIPPGAPNVGGLWEAGVKSVKTHLKKTIGETALTFEEMTTLLTQIEACLNSRPLYPIEEDPEKEILTPGHFLIGDSLLASPEQEIDEHNTSRRWALIQQMTQAFWKAWSSSYLHTLQQRYKWQKKENNLNIGDIVSIKDERLQHTKWPLARVVNIKPDADGMVRIVELQTGRSESILRHISKLCLIQKADDKETKKDTQKEKMNESPKCTKHAKLTMKQRRSDSSHKDIISTPITTTSTFTRPTARTWMRNPATDEIKGLVPPPKRTKKRGSTIAPCSWAKRILLTTTALAIIGGSNGNGTSYNITYPQSGLYLEKMGTIQLDRGHIKIECPISIETMTTDLQNVNKTIATFAATCDQSKEYTKDNHCGTWLSTFKEKWEQLTNNIDIIKSQSEFRNKRGLVGDFLHHIFGVNDEVYQSLDELQSTQNSLIKRTNHQSTLMLSTVHEVNATLSRFYTSVTEKLNTGTALINEMQAWFIIADKERIENHIIHTAIEAQNYIDEVIKKYENIAKTILHQGSIFNVINYNTFEKLRNNLNQQLPANLQTLHKPEDRIDILKKDNTIIIAGFIRLVETSTFDLVAASFIPQRINNNTFGTSLPETKFLAINFNDQRYFSTELKDIEKCTPLQKRSYVCAPSLIHNMELHSDCIIDYILNRHEEWTCPIRKFTVKEPIWKQLTMENTWLIISKEPVNAAINCHGTRTEMKIRNTAILKVQKGCIVTTRDNILLSKQQSTISVHSTYQKPTQQINLENLTMIKPYEAVKLAPIVGLETSYIPDLIDNEIKAIEPIATHHHQVTHHVISSTSSIGIVILIYIAWSYRHTIRRQLFRTRSQSTMISQTAPNRVQHEPTGTDAETTTLPPAPTPTTRTWITV
jgi:Pao retrotransposon peptidase/Protein of unknown function (DUF1759)/Family of unknown function (DUF5641)/Integrase zinc binding domain/Putative peptidase (DUF1758)